MYAREDEHAQHCCGLQCVKGVIGNAGGKLTASLAPLTALTNLSLIGSTLDASQVLQLPRSLRRLCVDFALPQHQLSRFTCLEVLALRLGEPLLMPSSLTALRLRGAHDHAAVCAQLSLLQCTSETAGRLRRLELGFWRDIEYSESSGRSHVKNDGRGFCDLGPCLPLTPLGLTALRLDGLRRLHVPDGLQQLAKLQVLQLGAELVLTTYKGQSTMRSPPPALLSRMPFVYAPDPYPDARKELEAEGWVWPESLAQLTVCTRLELYDLHHEAFLLPGTEALWRMPALERLDLPPQLAQAVAASAPQSRKRCSGAAAAHELVADLQAFRGADGLRAVVVQEASGCPWGPELLQAGVLALGSA